jgi:hypothetical protein
MNSVSETLYIIGNGFDRHHGIPSSYYEFGEFLDENDAATLEIIKRYFAVNSEFWSEFEEQLAGLDTDSLIDDASQFLVVYGADDWSDDDHHSYQRELIRVVDAISTTMRARFGEWVRQLPMPVLTPGLRLRLDPTSIFLNFNYTPSLQRLYGVDDRRVVHIHGAAAATDEQLVLGHGWKPAAPPDPYRFQSDPESADMRDVEGQQIVDDYFERTFKQTERVIRDHESFFASLTHIRTILVMGHSLAAVDHPYFREIIQRTSPNRAKWKISYYGDDREARRRFSELGLDPAAADFLQLTEF